MKFTIQTKTLLSKLSLANQTVDNLSLNPILSGVLVEVNEDGIILTSSNSSCSSKIFINENLNVEKEGKFLIKSKTLYEIINNISDDEVKFEIIDNGILRLTTKNYHSDYILLDTNSYPNISFDHQDWTRVVLKKSFFDNINTKLTNFIDVSNESLNHNVTGVLVDTTRKDNKIESIATNGSQLGYLECEYEGPKFKIVINPSNIKFISSITKDDNSDILFYLKDSKLMLETKNNLFLFKLIETNYPSVYRAIETNYPYSFIADKKMLSSAINRATVIAQGDKSPMIKFTISRNSLTLFARSAEKGTSDETISIESETIDKTYEFYFNIKFLNNVIKTLDDTSISFNFIAEGKQVVIKECNSNNFKTLLLPIIASF